MQQPNILLSFIVWKSLYFFPPIFFLFDYLQNKNQQIKTTFFFIWNGSHLQQRRNNGILSAIHTCSHCFFFKFKYLTHFNRIGCHLKCKIFLITRSNEFFLFSNFDFKLQSVAFFNFKNFVSFICSTLFFSIIYIFFTVESWKWFSFSVRASSPLHFFPPKHSKIQLEFNLKNSQPKHLWYQLKSTNYYPNCSHFSAWKFKRLFVCSHTSKNSLVVVCQ